MEQTTKICSMCRKEIDPAAMLCPYCRSNTNYKYFIEVPHELAIRERRPGSESTTQVIAIIVSIPVGLISMLFVGFWVGLFVGGAAGAAIYAVAEQMGVKGFDKAKIICRGCSYEDEYRWPGGTFEKTEPIYFNCTSCKQKTRIVISLP